MPLQKSFDPAEAEARLYNWWEQTGAFAAGVGARPGAPAYTVMIPPPNVNGRLHIGHAFNNTLQDILVRWHRMQGHDTLWQPGQDHAGIALQIAVTKELAERQINVKDLSRAEFLKEAWAYKERTADGIVGQLKKLGASCDWSRNAFTMSGAPGDTRVGHENSPNFHDAVIKVFVEMYEKGQIYRGKRLVNWDPAMETAISDLEVENIETPGHMWHFKYPLAGGATYEYVEKDADGNEVLRETRDYISIATTRPETMLGDGAVAVHPSDERYAPIVGRLCEIPVGPKEHRRKIQIVTDEYPDPNFGSGAVKITGAHDFNDYEVAKRGDIPMYRLMDTKGHMRDDGAPYAEAAAIANAVAKRERTLTEAETDAINLIPDDLRGLDRFEARKAVVDQITSEGLAVMTTRQTDEGTEEVPLVEAKPIMRPFGDRSKVVIEPMLTDQWFVDTAQIVGPALDAVRNGTTKIIPESGEKVYFHWLDNIEPWCISRQLMWGHQIPVWTAQVPTLDGQIGTWTVGATDSVPLAKAQEFMRQNRFDEEAMGGKLTQGGLLTMEFCAPTLDEAKEKVRKVWRERSGQDPENLVEIQSDPGSWYTNRNAILGTSTHEYEPVPMWRDPDVLDTWFSSGLWPIGTLGWPEDTEELQKYFPTSDLITGQDILFFWVARMMMMQLAVVDRVPFDTVYLHGLVRDAKGKKMSKSLGNVVDPLELIDEFGADALRFASAAMASLGGTLKLDLERIKGYRNFGTKLWNAARFAEMNDAYSQAGAMPTPSAAVNKWIIGETGRARAAAHQALEDYRFNDAALGLYAFVWGKVCDWYVELSKPLMQGDDAALKAETQATMAWVIDQCLILLHPMMPFITEELWGGLATRDTALIHAPWPDYGPELVDADADAELNWVIGLIEGIRSARAQMHVPAGAYIPLAVTGLTDSARAAFDANATMIKRLARIEALTELDAFPRGTVSLGVAGGAFGLPLADVIDVAAEKARLDKTLGKLAKEIGGLEGRLKNPKFAASAPEEVVEETRGNLTARQEERAKLEDALARLAELDAG
ncbi:MAG: valine--tRNA ligase [Pseudomonadota bacterium]